MAATEVRDHDTADAAGWLRSRLLSLFGTVRAFTHAPIEREAELRGRYRRVYVCRQYVREL